MSKKVLKYEKGDKVRLVRFTEYADPEYSKYIFKTAKIINLSKNNPQDSTQYDYCLRFSDGESFDVLEEEIIDSSRKSLKAAKILYAKS